MIDIWPGHKIGDLTVVNKLFETDKRGYILYLLKCRCGNETKLNRISILGNKATKPTKTCGQCYWKEKHPKAYNSWSNMWSRCTNPNNPKYHRYGERGIRVEDSKWLDFPNFLDDMGDPPKDILTGERYSLDRKDNDKGYYKDNCRWASTQQQAESKWYSGRTKPIVAS